MAARNRKKERALLLYQPHEFSYKKVAKQLGVSRTTVIRWLRPEYNARSQNASQVAKQRRKGVCTDCGGETKYNGHRGSTISSRCHSCQIAYLNSPERLAARTRWSPEKVIEAIQRWGAEHGSPPRMVDWNLRGTPEYPSASTVAKHFGSWNNAIEAAGFTPRLPTDRLMAAGERKKGEDH